MGRGTSQRGLSLVGAVTVFAVLSVLVLVSLPRLQDFALQENEADAAGLTRALGQELAQDAAAAAPSLPDLVQRAGLSRGLDNLEWLQDGRVLRRHGYLFELCADDGRPAIRAWPWHHGETGRAAFVFTAETLVGHGNHAARWSGPETPPEGPWVAAADWRVLD